MRKPAFCFCVNKRADQLRGNPVPLFSLHRQFNTSENFKPLTMFCGSTSRFVSNLLGNPEDRFSDDAAHIVFDVCYSQILLFIKRR